MKASPHPRQAERLAALHSYNILDTPREADFDDIVALAAKICGTPISVVNLIDAERQWFKAEVGLGTRETPLDTSICSHIILEQDFTIIEDTHNDPRTSDNELCTPADGLRFYAGALIKAENGLPIGTLCVLDNKPNSLNDDQRQALRVLTRRVTRELDLRRALQAQTILRDEMDHRVKNSLMSIAGAIRLYKTEARKTGDADAAFDALQRHLEAVSALHRAIYMSKENNGSVDLQEFMKSLALHLQASLPSNVRVKAETPESTVPHKIASTLGLVANEFAANTLKHGAAAETQTLINYAIEISDNKLILTCSNNVPEFSSNNENTQSGIGAKLMKASVAQFGGEIVQMGRGDGFELKATAYF
ncbi:two-component sensor histidine kinase [Litorimonas taeanensis]|uniref:Two-component sensor histidine kinase n=1 Tax=Litorimonas taeanensis TaxID=568099 RepID=A0A420WM69_9PROT|nr:histidine kinase dimerization/phosphoacceptor domain -containing protein [Litorimonas taeanensis]RKQ71996.1 two-component sensor histidine kinase [Litorimonas taeanensis]